MGVAILDEARAEPACLEPVQEPRQQHGADPSMRSSCAEVDVTAGLQSRSACSTARTTADACARSNVPAGITRIRSPSRSTRISTLMHYFGVIFVILFP